MSFTTGELPLRTLYAINVSSRAPDWTNPALQARQPNASSRERRERDAELERFRSELMTIADDLPRKRSNVPPEFLMPYVRNVFKEDLRRVDFPMALMAMDFLHDIDVRRRRERDAVLARLGVMPGDTMSTLVDRRGNDTPVTAWVKGLEKKAREAEACFTHCFIGLRHWTLFNEMSLQPLNQVKCLALLNTLYPPGGVAAPTVHITVETLEWNRREFFRYLRAVESEGPGVLKPLLLQGARVSRGEETGWPAIWEILQRYLDTASAIIAESAAVNGVESIVNKRDEEKRKRRPANSRAATPTPTPTPTPTTREPVTSGLVPDGLSGEPARKPVSTLDRFVAGLRRISGGGSASGSGESRKKAADSKPGESFLARTIRKAKSTTTLGDRDQSRAPEVPPFEFTAEMRRRAAEATGRNRPPPRSRHPGSSSPAPQEPRSFFDP